MSTITTLPDPPVADEPPLLVLDLDEGLSLADHALELDQGAGYAEVAFFVHEPLQRPQRRTFLVRADGENTQAEGTQDPDATQDWAFDMSAWLEPGDRLLSVAWAPAAEGTVTVVDEAHDDTAAVVWVQGGGDLRCRWQTVLGRSNDATIRIRSQQL